MIRIVRRNPTILSLDAILTREPVVRQFLEYCHSSHPYEAVAAELRASDFDLTFHYLKPEIVVVLVVLPKRLACDLTAIAAAEPSVFNEPSANLMRNDSFIRFGGHEFEVRLTLWNLRNFPGGIDDGVVVFGFIADDKIAVKHLKSDEELTVACQAACISTGRNYRPWKMWSEEELQKVKNAVEVPNPSVVTVRHYVRLTGGQ